MGIRVVVRFFFKQKTAYELRISDWSSDVCSSDLHGAPQARLRRAAPFHFAPPGAARRLRGPLRSFSPPTPASGEPWGFRSEEHTSELQSLMRISYAVFCLKKKKKLQNHITYNNLKHQQITKSYEIPQQHVNQ